MSKLSAVRCGLALVVLLPFGAGGCGDPTVEVVVPLAVVSVSPHDGATGIDPTAVPTVCFSKDMSAEAAAGNLVLETAAGDPIAGQSVVATATARCLSIAHTAPLEKDSSYLVHAKLGLPAADQQLTLAADVVSHFRTAP